ncbi:hypothetical protein DL768_009519 [Monosporascus sp. mg162]|nr:hypothetical protein DL768_009519 [Monosporascus sp. mg162]
MSNPNDYTVGWICAISTEYVAAQSFLDEKHDRPEHVSPNDNNDYVLGRIGKHNVVIAVLPDGEYGTASAASVARDMLHSFPNVRIGLMVGIGGGAPSRRHDIRLGDIVVSAPRDGKGGVFQYDFGKTIQDQSFQTTGFLNQPPMVLRTAVNGLKAQYESDGHALEDIINTILEKKPRLRKRYKRPDQGSDRLYRSAFVHPPDIEASCTAVCGSDVSNLISRPERTEDEDDPAIHYGLIASANQLMKDALIRDKLSAGKDVLCFEMEAAGLMNHFPCLVIRGICDYSDSHKNKEWQGYAAMTAAAYAKDLLCRIPPNKVEAEKRIGEILSEVLGFASKTGADVQAMKSKLDAKEDLEILDWITAIDYGPQHSDYLKRRQPGTGQWFLQSAEYNTWLAASKRTLFCPGLPGAGKTILSCTVVDDLRKRFHDDATVGIAYVYCNFRRHDEQKAEDLLSSLLKQLSQERPSLPETVKALYDNHLQKKTRPSLGEISGSLQLVAAMYSRVFIVIDALDECQEVEDCRKRFLSEIFGLQAKSAANVFATSRFIPEIVDRFKDSALLEIRADAKDMEKYLESHMGPLPSFVRNDRLLQDDIKARISEAVGGISLEDKLTRNAIRSALEGFRKQGQGSSEDEKFQVLADAYERTMERVNRQKAGYKTFAMKVLSWITCAKRPLSTLELQHALAIRVGQSKLDNGDLPQIEDLISVCAGLVTVDEESCIIRLIHYTTQEYFERAGNRWFPNAEADITDICVTYLSFSVFESGFCRTQDEFEKRLQLNPLYDYATQNWGHHARMASASSQAVIGFVTCQVNVEAASQALMVAQKWSHFTEYKQGVSRQMTGLHLAAFFGVREIVDFLLQDRRKVDICDSDCHTPLLYASATESEAVVQLLLEKGANIEAKNNNSQTPLSQAAGNGHEAVVQLLLENGANIEAKNIYGQTPLSQAAGNSRETIVQLLLEKGANTEAKNKNNQTPLSQAAGKGYEAIVQLLLEKGANIEAKDNVRP